jgi:2-methylcitrate dehydratase PrpD
MSVSLESGWLNEKSWDADAGINGSDRTEIDKIRRRSLTSLQNPENVTADLAQFIVESSWSDIPPTVRKEAKRSLLNHIGCALGGCRSDAVERALRVLDRFSGPREATLFGRPERVDIFAAACLNAMSSNVLTFDDTHVPTVMHPGSSVAPPLLAWSELRRVSGPELLHAFVLGVEACCRIGKSISPWHYSHGFLITSTCGVFGAAAGVGKLIGLSPRQMIWALGNAASQACGLVEALPDMAKSIAVGDSARNGLMAALLADQNFTGGERPVEGTFGFANVMGQQPDLSRITSGLGQTWELSSIAYKPYPTGVVLHPVIDACLQLRSDHALRPVDIEHIEVRGNPLLRERADRPSPRTGREASLSIQHCCAVAFIHGAAGLSQFTDKAVLHLAVMGLRTRVDVRADPSVRVEEAYVTVRTTSGATYTKHIPHLHGGPEWPMTDAELEAKFIDQAEIGVPGCDAKELVDHIWRIEELDDVAELIRRMALQSLA